MSATVYVTAGKNLTDEIIEQNLHEINEYVFDNLLTIQVIEEEEGKRYFVEICRLNTHLQALHINIVKNASQTLEIDFRGNDLVWWVVSLLQHEFAERTEGFAHYGGTEEVERPHPEEYPSLRKYMNNKNRRDDPEYQAIIDEEYKDFLKECPKYCEIERD